MSRVLVAGTYPPVPRPAAGVCLGAVRRALADGHQVQVVSPRPSAAHHAGTLSGVGGAFTLLRLQRRERFERLVLCLEPGLPLEQPSSSGWRAAAASLALGRVLRRFGTVELLVPPGMDVAAELLTRRGGPGVVVVHVDDGGPQAEQRVATLDGPAEWLPGEGLDRARSVLRRVVRRLLRAPRAGTRVPAPVASHTEEDPGDPVG